MMPFTDSSSIDIFFASIIVAAPRAMISADSYIVFSLDASHVAAQAGRFHRMHLVPSCRRRRRRHRLHLLPSRRHLRRRRRLHLLPSRRATTATTATACISFLFSIISSTFAILAIFTLSVLCCTASRTTLSTNSSTHTHISNVRFFAIRKRSCTCPSCGGISTPRSAMIARNVST